MIIFAGDKIRALTVSFEGMKLEDAIALLSCASSYKVNFSYLFILILALNQHW